MIFKIFNWRNPLFSIIILNILFFSGLVQGQSLRILQTTDIHGHFENVGENDAGWLRLATLIEKKRQEAGPENTLLIDCGDTIQGSFYAARSRGEIAVAMLRHLAYDVWVPGNHELDFGVERLLELLEKAGDIVLNGNLRITLPGRERQLPAWRLFERGGLRVLVIGANSGFLDHWHWGSHVQGYEVETAVAMLRREMKKIRAIADLDLIVLAIHHGLSYRDQREVNETVSIARLFPEIDLILGGHVHREIPGRRLGDKAWYVQAGAHGEYLAVIEVEYGEQSREIDNISSHLVPVTAETPSCPQAEAALLQWLKPARQAAAATVTELAESITARGRPGRSSQTSELLSRAIAAAVNAEIVIHGRLSNADLPSGPITHEDVFSLVPYENKLAVLKLTREELIAIINEQMTMRRSYAACGIYGLFVELDDQEKVVELFNQKGDPLPENDRYYKVAFNSYTLAGGGNRFPILREIVTLAEAENRVIETSTWTREAVLEYLKKANLSNFEAVRWLR